MVHLCLYDSLCALELLTSYAVKVTVSNLPIYIATALPIQLKSACRNCSCWHARQTALVDHIRLGVCLDLISVLPSKLVKAHCVCHSVGPVKHVWYVQ